MKGSKPTSFDIAYRAGVSQPTVSRALRNSPLVSKETRERVQAIAKELNYKVDINARNLRAQSAKTLALLICEDPGNGDSLINPFFLAMLGSITKACAVRGYDLLISFQQDSEDWAADYEDTHRADGIIFLGYGDYQNYAQRIAKLDEIQAHFITWGPVLEGQPGFFIGCDNRGSAHAAVQHLIKLGRQRIAFLGDNSEKSPEFRARYNGYTSALLEAKKIIDPALQENAQSTEQSGYQAMKKLIDSGAEFDAVFAASDLIALGALKALNEVNRNVPQQVSLIGFDDIAQACYSSPSLTTVKQDTVLAGQLLVDKLIELIDGQTIESHQLSGELIVRESCGGAS
ncbi:LacI family DNA-binding transcriptional regulator [Agaribacterium haliotis]|uniref:LacI family DNA-binding transcriptional regulator n=1 Tax=Agaribacterium haliotis TaxID=2013869 RepID=UPI000BB53F22|nr:LacI family DNA-binding transcriptional regulator [Agaribacterium haliotis]